MSHQIPPSGLDSIPTALADQVLNTVQDAFPSAPSASVIAWAMSYLLNTAMVRRDVSNAEALEVLALTTAALIRARVATDPCFGTTVDQRRNDIATAYTARLTALIFDAPSAGWAS